MADYKPFSLSGGDANNGDTDAQINGDDGASSATFLGGSDGGSSGSGERDANGERFDASIHISPDKRNADGSFRKKRGRKSGNATASTRSRSKASNQASVEGLTRMLAIIHMGIASATKTPELKLEDEEAEALAKSTAVVLEEFDIRPDPKIEAIIGLVTTAGMIYGPRVYLIAERKKQEKRDKDN